MLTVAETIAFQPFAIDCRRRVLLAGGKPVALHARAFDMLVFLVQARDRVVSRDEITAQVWKGLAVGENNLTVQMSALRRALAEHGGEGLIITVPGCGYRFVGDVADAPEPRLGEPSPAAIVAAPPPEPAPRAVGIAEPDLAAERSRLAIAAVPARRPRRVAPFGWIAAWVLGLGAALGLALMVAGGRHGASGAGPPFLSLAVLPFRNLSDGGGGGYMADAITDDLTTDLAHIPGSAVTSRASAEGFRDRGGSAARIGAALNVRYLVDGSLRAADGTFLIDVALIEAASGRQLWAQRFATTVVRLAAAQTQIVRRIASALDVELPNIVSANSLRDRPNNPTSEDLFIRAYATLMQEDTLAGYTRAQHLLEQAVRLEPGFGDALAELGLTLILKLQSAVDPAAYADLAEARDVIGRSLDLASNPIALAANARLLEYEGACEQAVPSAQAALALEPNSIDALAVLAKCATEAGHFDQASDYLRTVLQLNPDSVRSKPRLALLTQAYLLQGRYGEAIESGNRALAGDRPPQPGADSMGRAEYVRLMIMAATALSGDVAGARALYAEYRAVWPNRSAWRVAAYSPEGLASSAGFAKFITGLTQAGMPMYADERAAAPDPSDTSAVQEGDFARSPLVIRGARTLDTPAMAALIAHGGVTVFDLGQGAAVIRNAILVTAPADRTAPPLDGWPADRIPADKQAPIVVMGDGVYGTAAVAAVRSLVARFYQHVYWYRGGEEAWAAAGLPSEDRRQQL